MADSLPERWSYGVRADGRVFFVSDHSRSTTWLHPRSGLPVNSGHMIRSDLPRGWEEGFTPEGACYFIDHIERRTTFIHPQTGQTSPENSAFVLQEQAPKSQIMSKPGAELSSISDTSTNLTSSSKSLTRSSSKVHSFGKRQQSVKRNPNVPVEVRGWLYKQDSSGMRLWKRKWFVLADFCLFYYKDSREQSVLGSIPLPSYEVSPVGPQDHISRKYAFKARHSGPSKRGSLIGPSKRSSLIGPSKRSSLIGLSKRGSLIGPSKRSSLIGPSKRSSLIGSQAEHTGMRTYFFSADTQEDMSTWIRAMNRASRVQNQTGVQTEVQTEVQTHTEVRNGVSRVQNGVHCGTNTAPDRSSDLLDQISVCHKDSTQSSEKTLVHEVLLEPVVHRVHREDLDLDQDETECRSFKTSPAHLATPPVATPPVDTSTSVSAPVSRAPSQNRFPADFSRNGLASTPSPILEPNGIAAGTYQKTPPLATPPGSAYRQATPTGDTYRQATPLDSSLNRRSVREQVQNWVKVQKGAPSRDSSLHRRTPPTQFSPIEPPPEYNPSAGRVGEYRYAQDRLSHFGLSEPPGQSNPFWRLYEWQQRLQYRHGSPTAPLYNPAPQYPYGPRPLTAADHSRAPTPRCVPVPPSAADVPPPLPPLSGPTGANRRPHTPAERLTVRPTNERAAEGGPFTTSPRRTKSQFFKASTLERRSVPVSGYMTHTVSAPSLHGKTVDDTYLQLKKDLEYLDLKIRALEPLIVAVHSLLLHCTAGPLRPLTQVVGSPQLKEAGRPVKVAESDIDVKLSRLCEQDRILKDLETRISSLKEDKDKLESVLDMSHQQMEQFSDQVSRQKISHQQRLLQEDLVHVRAQISRAYTEMSSAWDEYVLLERSVEQLRSALQQQMDLSSSSQQERLELKRELWRIEDVMAGLSSSKTNYWLSVQSVLNPDRKLVPSVQESVPSTTSLHHSATPPWSEDSAPPRPPLPCFYDDEDSPPEVPPLPREATVIRHTSVRGLKRQSDERRRDREGGLYSNGEWKSDLRSFLSEPELPLSSSGPTDLDQAYTGTDLCGSSSGLNQSSVSAFVTLRRGPASDRERPKSAFECSSSPALDSHWSSSVQSRGRMSADEQLERLKRHQRALVRDRQRSLGQSEEERPIAEGQSDGRRGQGRTVQSEARLQAGAVMELEPEEYELDLSRELSRPAKVQIPERLDSEPEEVLSPEEQQERQQRAERIRNMLTKSSVQILSPLCVDFSELDSVLQQQQRIMNASQTLAKQASLKGRLLKTAKASAEND